MARSGIVWNVLRVVLCPFKKYESKRERERERERESDISIFKKMKVLYPGCLIKVTVRMGENLFYCGCLVAFDFQTSPKL